MLIGATNDPVEEAAIWEHGEAFCQGYLSSYIWKKTQVVNLVARGFCKSAEDRGSHILVNETTQVHVKKKNNKNFKS